MTKSTYTIWVGNSYIDSTRNTPRGLQDVAICGQIIGNSCYVHYMGGQLEQVLEDAVALSYLPDMDAVDNAVIALREAGIMGALSIRSESIDGEVEELKIIPAEYEPATTKEGDDEPMKEKLIKGRTMKMTKNCEGNITGAVAEYAGIVEHIATDYDNNATVATIRTDHPELDFMDDDEIADLLSYAARQSTSAAAAATAGLTAARNGLTYRLEH